MKSVTLVDLQKKNACSTGLAWWETEFGSEPASALDVLTKAPKEKAFDWAIWLVAETDRPLCVRVLCDFAERVLPIFESKFPDDKRPRDCIAAARVWVANTSAENKEKARTAAYAAYAAAFAAHVVPFDASAAAFAASTAAFVAFVAAFAAVSASDAARAADVAHVITFGASDAARAERKWQRQHLERVLREAK